MRAAGPRATSTRCPVTISTPSERASASSASAIAPLPPRASGHPTAWASIPSTSPKEPLNGWPSGSIECAASPANSARAAGSRKARRTRSVGREQRRHAEPGEQRAGAAAGGSRAPAASAPGAPTRGRAARSAGARRRRPCPAPRRCAARSRSRTTLRPGAERMRDGRLRVHPLQPVTGQVQRPEERRGEAQRVDGGADVVDEARQRQLGGARPAADRVAPPRRRGRTGRPARGRWRRRARSGPPRRRWRRAPGGRHRAPVAMPRGLSWRLAAAGAQRAGAVTVDDGHVHGRAVPEVARRSATGAAGRRTPSASSTAGCDTPSERARFSSVCSQNRSFARFAPKMYESSMNGSLVRSRACTWTTGLVLVAVGGEGDPCGQRVTLGRHERERLAVSVDHQHARRHLHGRSGDRRDLEQGDLARRDPGERRVEVRALGPEGREARLPVRDDLLGRMLVRRGARTVNVFCHIWPKPWTGPDDALAGHGVLAGCPSRWW